ncbi:hypothetical protein PLEOSDRAFT_32088, partial [Pleurotus ostreatus PC15]
SGGIGRATSLALARLGCSISIYYHSAKEKVTALADELKTINAHIHVQVFQADMDDVRRLHAEVVAQMGHPDILFNNAGITGARIGARSNMEDMSLEAFEHILEDKHGTGISIIIIRTHGIWMLLARVYIRSDSPDVFSVAAGTYSDAMELLGGVSLHYASSKSALHGLMHWVASRYAKDGVHAIYQIDSHVASCVETLVSNAYMTNKASFQWLNGRSLVHGRI